MARPRALLAWLALGALILVPVAIAAASPLLEWRGPVYIAACFAGIGALGILLLQPLLAGGDLPGLPTARGRRVHRITGVALVCAVALHVGGLWVTSPPDVIDALLFRSPAPFSAWGVAAMWTLLGAAALAAVRRPFRIAPRLWRPAHTVLALATVAGSVIHALLVQGTMGTTSKVILCLAILAAAGKTARDLRSWAPLLRGVRRRGMNREER